MGSWPNGEPPCICSKTNDCANIIDNNLDDETAEHLPDDYQLPSYPGMDCNAKMLLTQLGKIFYVTTRDIKAGEEIFCRYGNVYWRNVVRQLQALKVDGAIPKPIHITYKI
jgi:hypothetical protein